jgi:hypothetical protein
MGETASLWVYETAAVVATALPEAEREQFAALLAHLSRPTDPDRQRVRANGARRWLRDSGWES